MNIYLPSPGGHLSPTIRINRIGLSGACVWPLTPIGGLAIVDPVSVQLATLLRTFGRFGSFFLRLKPTVGSTSFIKKDGHTSPKTTREMPMIGSIVMTIVSYPIPNGIKPPHVRDPNGVKLLMRRTTWRKVLVRRSEELLSHLNVDAIPGAVLVVPLPVI